MGNGFIATLIATAKNKITPIITKLRFFLTPQFWRTKVLTKFREIFSKIFDVRPKDKDDYYSIGRYLVSKRLAYALVLTIGVLSAVYLIAIRGVLLPKTAGIKEYKYTSVLLRFTTSDKVIIKGKGGYKAYEGAVKKGFVSGPGRLYDKEGNLVYQGNFESNRYNGVGNSYYPSGGITYSGMFTDNLYEGQGKLYRENGVLSYTGDFSQGMKNGEGTLCDESGKAVYTGTFSQDELVYSALIGKSASEIKDMYVGSWTAYESQYGDYCVHLPDIEAIYEGITPEESVEDEISVGMVYVLKDKFRFGGVDCKSISDIEDLLGEPVYQGNSRAIMPEAVAIKTLSRTKSILNGPIKMDYTQEYEEYCSVNSYDDYILYLYSFEKDGTRYTFYCADKGADFAFYSVSAAGEAEEGEE